MNSLSMVVILDEQCLELLDCQGQVLRQFQVSTALNGAGEQNGSGCTPRGWHVLRACIGAGAPRAAVFRGRRLTGEVWTPGLAAANPGRDWILSRILWLSGSEPGRNRLGNVDTMRRYIYIHGTPDDQPMGVALSHGCIRMRNDDVIELFDSVKAGTGINIVESRDKMQARQVARQQVQVEMADWTHAEARVMPVRETVFVVEQQVPIEIERDEYDPVSRHAMAVSPAGEVIGTGRLLPDGHIGRMAVLKPWRGKGIGALLLTALMKEARLRGLTEAILNAQVAALGFYESAGFEAEGDVFMEAGIPHREMRRKLD